MEEGCGQGKRKVRLAVTFGVLIALVLLIVILAIVFKPRKPITTIDTIKPHDTNMDFDIFTLRLNLNVSLDVEVTVKNPNSFKFKYLESTAYLNYKGQLIGQAPVPQGEIEAGEAKKLSLTLILMADRLLADSQGANDVISGILPLNTFTKISGHVSFLGFIKVNLHSSSSCDFTVNLNKKTVGNPECKSTTEL